MLINTKFDLLTRIRLSISISKSERILCFLFEDRFWFVHILFICMGKFQSLVQFPVDHLSHPVVPSLVLLLCQLAVFDHYVSDSFIYVSTYSVAYYQFLLWYNWSLWHYSVLLLTAIQFLSLGFLSFAMYRFSLSLEVSILLFSPHFCFLAFVFLKFILILSLLLQ